MGVFLTLIYTFCLAFILLYSLMQLHLVYTYLRARMRQKAPAPAPFADADLPRVTIQLPLYNEMYVTERLIDAVAAFDYPHDRLEIQILDDSTDETVAISARKAAEYQARGIDIVHVRRPERKGFKAGALAYGLEIAKGDFIAIFDADFLPEPDFLRRTLPWFRDPGIGVVQTRWQHLNEDYSILTQLQAFALDAHFSVEQGGRNLGGCFINFNGTAGIWRRQAIVDGGGWQSDTLTEDLDLSYRAQLKGWRFKFLEEVESPSELPANMPAIKSQQFRWTKGAAETARKNLWNVLRARLPLHVRIHALFHLLNSFLFICILLSGILSLPLLFIKQAQPELEPWFRYASVFMLSLVSLVIFFGVARLPREKGSLPIRLLRFLLKFPLFLGLSMGMSLHNAIATFEGYIGRKTPFVRTPKFNLKDVKDKWQTKKAYLGSGINLITVLEGVLCLCYLGGALWGVHTQDYTLVPYHCLLFFGYGGIFYFSIRHSYQP